MKKFAIAVMAFVMCVGVGVCFVPEAEASTLSFQNFTALRGVTISTPYQANAGTERDPDTVTLTVDLAASMLEFQLTAVGSGFVSGSWCELDWDNESYGAPRENIVTLSGGGFSAVQKFSLNTARLNLASRGTRRVMYELDADEEPRDSYGDSERHLLVTFVASGSVPTNPTNPNPGGTSSLSFQNFTAGRGVTISAPYQANAGTERDPDTVTLTVDLSASILEFHLTAVGSGFVSGTWCELDWDNESYGAPRESVVTLSGGGFSAVQNFSLNTARLNLAGRPTRSVMYELDADEEPRDSRGDSERHLLVTFVASGSAPNNPTNPTNPNPGNGTPALSFQNLMALRGAMVTTPYQANTGTEFDPDTVTLTVDLSSSVLEFQLTAVGSGFVSGSWCELDWDSESYGAPLDNIVTISNGGFSAVQSFSLNTARLNLVSGGTRTVMYELDADEEPYDSQWDAERHLLVTFVTSSSNNPANPSDPTNPGGNAGGTNESGGGGGGCNSAGAGVAALLGAALLLGRSVIYKGIRKN